MNYDAIIVGSGFGGSVSAARLAEKGLRVLVLERGPWWGPANQDKPAEVRRAYPRGVAGSRKFLRNIHTANSSRLVNADGLFELHRFDALTAITGSGVGGGSHIYTNIQQPADDAFFDRYFPEEITAAEMKGWYRKVRETLRPSPLPPENRPEKNVAFEKAGIAADLGKPTYPDLAIEWKGHGPGTTNAGGLRQQACDHCGTCIVGCENTAKTTLDLTYIPLARRHGAEVRALAEVTAIGETDEGYVVRYVDHRSGMHLQEAAPRLILAAGTLNTVRLLLRARDVQRSLARLGPALGRNFTPNGDMGMAVLGTRSVRNSTRGAAFNAFYRGNDLPGQPYLIGEVGMPLDALPISPVLRRLLRTSVVFVGMGSESRTGRLFLVDGALQAEASRELDPTLYAAIESLADAVGSQYRPRRIWYNWPGGRGARALATVHPLGGASIGRTPEEGLVDHRGQVFGHRGLYVADGALYPHAPGVPPSMTIAALAERIASLME